jgi:hypothetical protein
VAASEIEIWVVEEIPDSDHVYMRAHKTYCPGGNLEYGVFRDRGKGMSVDWEKYSSATETQNRGTTPSENGVIKLKVAEIHEINSLVVRHSPIQNHPVLPDNRAHSDVLGLLQLSPEDFTQARFKLKKAAEVVIPIPS